MDTTVISPFSLSMAAHVATNETKSSSIIIACIQDGVMKQMNKTELLLWIGTADAQTLAQVLATGNNGEGLNIANVAQLIDGSAKESVGINAHILFYLNGTIASVSYGNAQLLNTLGNPNIVWGTNPIFGDILSTGNGTMVTVNDSVSSLLITNTALNAVVNINGVAGFTGTGAYTTFTIDGGIITAAS